MEAGQAARNEVLRVITLVTSTIADRLSLVLKDDMPKNLFQEMKLKENADSLLTAYLREICAVLTKPLVLFIDEIDALGYEVTMEMRENRDRSIRIIPEMIYKAQERIKKEYDAYINLQVKNIREEFGW